jgi:hypothetical protein
MKQTLNIMNCQNEEEVLVLLENAKVKKFYKFLCLGQTISGRLCWQVGSLTTGFIVVVTLL